MKKRLVITGLPCPAGTWEGFLGAEPGQRIISMHEVLAATNSADPRVLSRYVTEQIAKERPTSIVCHGIGVPLTLRALMRLKRRGVDLDARLTIFNGAVRSIPLSQARQPLRVQWTPVQRMVREVERNGGAVDPQLLPYVSRIRSLFRILILQRLADKMASAVGLDVLEKFPKRAGLSMPVQIIASPNDPYLPFECMERLRRDLVPDRFIEAEYGHFPYSEPTLSHYLHSFESLEGPFSAH
jgi:predicted alpha/beta hydrolase family esterase